LKRGKLSSRLLYKDCYTGIAGQGGKFYVLARLRHWEERDVKTILSLDMQTKTTGHEDGETRAGSEQLFKKRGCSYDLFKVVEKEEEASRSYIFSYQLK